MSTAESVTKASSPGARPATFTGTEIGPRGRATSGASSVTSSLCESGAIPNHATPIARPGIRFSATSSGRCVSATA